MNRRSVLKALLGLPAAPAAIKAALSEVPASEVLYSDQTDALYLPLTAAERAELYRGLWRAKWDQLHLDLFDTMEEELWATPTSS